MKIRYEAPKYSRIKKGYTRCKGEKYKNFLSVKCNLNGETYWWSRNTKRWFTDSNQTIEDTKDGCSNAYQGVDNMKSLRRFAKKHSGYLPKGTVLTLESRFRGFEIYCIL